MVFFASLCFNLLLRALATFSIIVKAVIEGNKQFEFLAQAVNNRSHYGAAEIYSKRQNTVKSTIMRDVYLSLSTLTSGKTTRIEKVYL